MPKTEEERAAHAAYMREFRRKNPESGRAAKKRYREKIKNDPELAAKDREYHRKKQAAYRAANPEARRGTVRKSEILAKYGLTVQQYDEMLASQNGVCAICERPPGKKRLCVDHDHLCCPGIKSCGKCVRGLLCDRCNRGIGLFGDSPQALKKAIRYLKKWVPA